MGRESGPVGNRVLTAGYMFWLSFVEDSVEPYSVSENAVFLFAKTFDIEQG